MGALVSDHGRQGLGVGAVVSDHGRQGLGWVLLYRTMVDNGWGGCCCLGP